MGWGSATGLRVIGVATKKSFPASLRLVPFLQIRGPPLSHFLPEILICCHRCKNLVPQYSILHYYIIGGRSAKKGRLLSCGSGERSWWTKREKRVYLERLFFFFSFSFLAILLRARSVSSDVYSIIFSSSFSSLPVYSCLSVSFFLSFFLGLLISTSFVRVYYFLKLVDARRYREVLSRDIPVSNCCKLMM